MGMQLLLKSYGCSNEFSTKGTKLVEKAKKNSTKIKENETANVRVFLGQNALILKIILVLFLPLICDNAPVDSWTISEEGSSLYIIALFLFRHT